MEFYLVGEPNFNAVEDRKVNSDNDFSGVNKFELWYRGIELKNINPKYKGTSDIKKALKICKNYHEGNPLFPDGTRPFGLVVEKDRKYFIYTSNTGVNAHRIREKTQN